MRIGHRLKKYIVISNYCSWSLPDQNKKCINFQEAHTIKKQFWLSKNSILSLGFNLKSKTQRALKARISGKWWFAMWFEFGLCISKSMIRFVIRIRFFVVLWFDSWFGFVYFEYMIRIRDSNLVPQNLRFGFVIRNQHSEFMIRIRDSDSVTQNIWFGFVIRRIIANHESCDSRIIWFVDHWFLQRTQSIISNYYSTFSYFESLRG